MNRDQIEWLTRQPLPMFSVERLRTNLFEVVQIKPPMVLRFECSLDEFVGLVMHNFSKLGVPAREVALKKCVQEFADDPERIWAGPVIEECNCLIREGIFGHRGPLTEIELRGGAKKIVVPHQACWPRDVPIYIHRIYPGHYVITDGPQFTYVICGDGDVEAIRRGCEELGVTGNRISAALDELCLDTDG